MKRGKRIIGVISAGMIGAGAVFGTGMITSGDMFGTQEVQAADDIVVLNADWVNYDDNGDGTCTITDFNYIPGTSPTKIEIPVTIDGLAVTKIGDGAFQGCGLTYVRFHKNSTITEIGANAFRGNPITEFVANGDEDQNIFPLSVKKLGDRCFDSNKIKNIYLKDLEELKEIPAYAFNECRAIETLVLPKNLEKIGSYAFSQMEKSYYVKIPGSVTTIGDQAFSSTNSYVRTIDLSEHEPDSLYGAPWHDFGAACIWKDTNKQDATYDSPFLFDKEQALIYGLKDNINTTDYSGWNHETGALTIPVRIDGKMVEGIACGAFSGRKVRNYIKTVQFEEGSRITKLQKYTFLACTQIEEITNIPSTIKTIENMAFRDATGFKELVLPGVTRVEGAAFWLCRSLEKITFKSNQLTVTGNMFSSDTNLNEINFPNIEKDGVSGAPWGGEYAVIKWKNGEVTEPKISGVVDKSGNWKVDVETQRLLWYVGEATDTLVVPSSIEVDGVAEPVVIESVGDGIHNILHKNENGVTSIDKIVISDGIKTLNSQALAVMKISSIDLGNTLEDIRAYSIRANNLTNVTFPSTLKTIGNTSFISNKLTGEIILPGNLMSVTNNAFNNNPNIDKITVKQYRSTASDPGAYDDAREWYKKSPTNVQANAPWGANNAANQVYYMDTPRAVGKNKVTVDAQNNKLTISYEGYTNNNFYIVKNIAPKSGMPDIVNEGYPTAQGMRYPATAEMEVTSKTANGKQGGNGIYAVDMTFGSQIEESGIEDKIMPYSVTINHFKTLTYNANNGNKPMTGAAPTAGDVYVQGYKPAIKGAGTMKITGYTFGGWNTQANGKGVTYQEGSTDYAMPNKDATLYAVWNQNSYDVTYNAGEGKFKDNKNTKTLTGKMDQNLTTLNPEVPTREGYEFVGWAKTSDATSPNITTVPAENTTVYAVWKAGTGISVVFNGNGGKFGNAETKTLSGTVDTLLTSMNGYAVPTQDGYDFKGWSTSPTGSVDITKVPTSNSTVFAVWSPKNYKITFNANGGKIGSATTKEITGPYLTEFTVLSGYTAPTRDGWNFEGWATTAGAQTANITAVPNKAQTVYAVWSKKTVEVTFNPMGGKFGNSTANKKLSGLYETIFRDLYGYIEPDKADYDFKGWSTSSAEGRTVNITNVPSSAKTVYAVWTPSAATADQISAAKAKVTAAQTAINNAIVSTNGADVWASKEWVTQSAKDAYASAVSTASAIINKSGVTSLELKAALADLQTATDTFNAAKRNGSRNAQPEIAAAQNAIDKASTSKTTAQGAIDATQAEINKNAASDEALAKAQAAVAAANTAKTDATAAQTAAGAAVTAANSSGIAAEKTTANGQKTTAAGLVTDTTAQVSAANALLAQVQAAREAAGKALQDAKDAANAELDAIDVDAYSGEDKTNVEDAIAQAREAIDNAKTPAEVETALNTAKETIGKQKTDEQKLQDAKDAAKKELDDVDVNAYSGKEKEEVEKIIEDAKKAIDDAATIPEVNNIKEEALNKIKEIATDDDKKNNVSGVSLDVKDAVIEKGKSITLKATVAPSTAKDKTVTWKSSNTKVATVDKNGKVTGVKQGTVKITVTTNDGKKTATANVRVLFDDVKKGHTFYNPIYWAADNGVTYGVTGTNNFAPANTVTRGQVIAFLYRMDGNPKTTGFKNKFKDVTTKSTFYNPILWGGKSQVVAGYPDGTFREKVTCTRGQIVAFIWRMAGKPEPKTKKSSFKDVNTKNTFYKAILWAAENGITVGYNDGTFRSGGNCTRGQMVAFLQRFAKQYPSKVKL